MRVSPSAPPDEADDLHAALASESCHAVVAHFACASETAATLDELAAVLATERDVDEADARVRLHHATLPRLDDAGLVDYDPGSKTVRYHGHPALVVADDEDTECTSNAQ